MPEAVDSVGTSPGLTRAEDRLAANLTPMLERRGLTQEQLATAMTLQGYSWHASTVYKVVNGKRKVSLGEAMALARVLEVSLDALTNDSAVVTRAEILFHHQRDLAGDSAAVEAAAVKYETTRWHLQQSLVEYELDEALRAYMNGAWSELEAAADKPAAHFAMEVFDEDQHRRKLEGVARRGRARRAKGQQT